MSTETIVEAPAVEVVEQAPATAVAVEFSPVEQQASEQGWMPKEKWEADGKSPDDWKPAAEFVRTGELYKTIHQLKRETKSTQAALTALQKHHQYVFERAHQQAVNELKKDRRQALRSDDVETVEKLDEQIEQAQTTYQKEKVELVQQQQQAAASAGPAVEFESWKSQNAWYERDSDMRELADAQGLIYLSKNPGASPDAVLKHVDQKIRKHFPEKFGAKRAAPNPTASVDKTTQRSAPVVQDVDMDDAQREIMNTFVRSGVMTKEQYIKELKKVKDR